jgi:DNA-binding MurR/RpiR family transcriptional regulator
VILENIRQVYPQLTKSQRRLADFIANSYHEAAFMTASRMAKRVSVNEATVIRFAQRLGYSGYPQLIRDVQMIVQQELKAPSEPEAQPAPDEPFLAALGGEVEHLQRAVNHVSPELAHRLVSALRGARRIYVVGQGVSYYLAGLLATGLASLGLDARVTAGDPQSLALAVADVMIGDAFVGIAATRESPEVAQALVAARERGANTLAVAWSPISGPAQAADLALTCPGQGAFPMPSTAAMAAFLDALVQALASVDRVRVEQFDRAVTGTIGRLRPD